MFITEVISKGKKGQSYTSILLRESYRVGAAVKSSLPAKAPFHSVGVGM